MEGTHQRDGGRHDAIMDREERILKLHEQNNQILENELRHLKNVA